MHPRIGRFTSTTLAGDVLRIPGDLGRPTLLVFAYERMQQGDVESWIQAVAGSNPLRVLEVPVLGRRWLPGRRAINGGMASQMDRTTREQTMCVYTNVAAFRRDVLGVTSTEILAALVTPDGTVRWHAIGPADNAGAAALRAAVAELE
ncbi:MAG: hypothetical protein ACJA2F_001587 [Nitriliruptoraceae bacterium]|jgi:hypothetical protein